MAVSGLNYPEMKRNRIYLLPLMCAFNSAHLTAQEMAYAEDSVHTVTVSTILHFGDQLLETDTRWYITPSGDSVQINRFVCYLSGFTVTYADSSTISETHSYHLLDASEPETMTFELKNVPAGAIRKITFAIGVDSTKSVSGGFGGDLDPVHGMYWAWNSGYINAKLEGTSPRCSTFHHAFQFHIGGYLPHERTLREVSFPVSSDQAVSGITLIADVSSWFTGIELATTSSIVMPGAEAVRMADTFHHLFQLQQP
jgi:hypothetical protein